MSYESIFDFSYERSVKRQVEGEDFFACFYHAFLASSDDVRSRFANTDMAIQRRMLKKSFYNLLAFYASGSVDSVLERIGETHSRHRLNISPHFYDLWLECLIATVAKFDPEFTPEVELAWRLVLSPGITYMKFKFENS
jgi:hemoglobin-like flavoprotein